ncbi:MAG TPA: lysylphosphatidylglycerol synthase domain-containing protein, partial [Desulfatiglandales bacterium]|nr:lysylphosphatidylglycerol synthase domain-containing protein [Desulfatiglandales bacterium]
MNYPAAELRGIKMNFYLINPDAEHRGILLIKNMKHWYKYLVYISLIFLGVLLYNADFLKVPKIFSIFSLLISFIFLFAGFFANTLSWKHILKKSNYHVVLSECLAGVGLSIFWKYIPGKVWMILGRAAYITEKKRYPIGKLSAISLNAQFIDLWIGLIFGLIGLLLLGKFHPWGWIILFFLLVFTAVIFSKLALNTAEWILKIVLRK